MRRRLLMFLLDRLRSGKGSGIRTKVKPPQNTQRSVESGQEALVGAAGLEPATLGLEGRCSIHLSYAPGCYSSNLAYFPGNGSQPREAKSVTVTATAAQKSGGGGGALDLDAALLLAGVLLLRLNGKRAVP